VDCFCGCGTKVPRGLIDTNLEAGKVALELLAWDKARASRLPDPADADVIDPLIAGGAGVYQALLGEIHGESNADTMAAARQWLKESLDARRHRPDMTERGFLSTPGKLRITKLDSDRLDRARPELSFSGATAERPGPGEPGEPDPDRAAEDPVAQLRGLEQLHAAGALTDAEFAAAKSRVIARL
jgi:hypothetical protein